VRGIPPSASRLHLRAWRALENGRTETLNDFTDRETNGRVESLNRAIQ
jgi:hypothetical protein